MIEPAKYIRKAFFAALNNNLTYDGAILPVYDSFSDEDNGAHQVMITNMNGENQDDKVSFASDWTLVLDIVTRTDGSGNKSIADAIGEQITTILQPSRKTTGLTIDSPFQLLNLQLQSSRYLEEETDTRYLVRKLLTYRFRIVQD